jgi:hypothetical protein
VEAAALDPRRRQGRVEAIGPALGLERLGGERGSSSAVTTSCFSRFAAWPASLRSAGGSVGMAASARAMTPSLPRNSRSIACKSSSDAAAAMRARAALWFVELSVIGSDVSASCGPVRGCARRN